MTTKVSATVDLNDAVAALNDRLHAKGDLPADYWYVASSRYGYAVVDLYRIDPVAGGVFERDFLAGDPAKRTATSVWLMVRMIDRNFDASRRAVRVGE